MSNMFFDAGPSRLSRPKVLLATTAYDSPDASYTAAIANSRDALHREGISTSYLLLQGNCHVDDARNLVVREFLQSDCDEMVFLDADVSWEPEQLVKLCEYDCDLVGGVYPYRRQNRKEGMPVRNIKGCYAPDENGLLEVEGLPTGFMRIRRVVLETLAKDATHHAKERHVADIPEIFGRETDSEGRRWGGDINFCRKWLKTGGKIYAAANLRLGHCAKVIIKDSLAASLRRQMGASLKHCCEQIRDGQEDGDTFWEASQAVDNPWAASTDMLYVATRLARESTLPILETGSGLSTVLMAAATDQTVWCLEHDPIFAMQTERMARTAGVLNIAMVVNPLVDGWYDINSDIPTIPERFGLAFVDGPPRQLGNRMTFFDVLAHRCDVIFCDDADDAGYTAKLENWAAVNGFSVDYIQERGAVLRRVQRKAA